MRKQITRAGNHNWIISVDDKGRALLLTRKRICIDFERIRIVDYIPIIRCFKCQKFGHVISKCENEQICPKCAENHEEKVCKADFVKCGNCYFEGADTEANHRADSADCKFFKTYRASVAQRL